MADPRIAYGFWRYQPDELEVALEMIECAREGGLTHFDTADIYGGREHFGAAETLLGKARQAAPSLFSAIEIGTKAGVEYGTPYNSSREFLEKAIDGSLRRLGVEQIDLFYIHRPDFLAHPSEVAGALDQAVAQGKVKSVGVSNYTSAQLAALGAYLKAPLAAHQIEFSLLETAPLFNGLIDHAMEKDLPIYAWSPLAGGRMMNDERVAPALGDIAAEKNCSPAAAALAFILRHPAGITPIIGTKNTARFREALAAQAVSLTRKDWYRLLEAGSGRRMP